MLVKIQLKNSPNEVLVDDFVYEYLCTNPYLKSLDLVHNLREHSSGRAVFQKSWRQNDGKYKTETLYLHKLVAERFIKRGDEDNQKKNPLVKIINKNKLDCRVKNLEWSNRSVIKRNSITTRNKTGYIGVFQDKTSYRAVIYQNKKAISLGSYKTAEEAAMAYNKKAIELYGNTKGVNKIKTPVKVSSKSVK